MLYAGHPKIKTVKEIADAVHGRSAVMCHGVFDIVHPGHIRHMLYAKSKADILIASITGDNHVTKGRHRPHVPQDIRAANLAVLEFVDYVIIDDNPTPIANIEVIKPRWFAKGFEYQRTGISAKTREEIDLVQSYGGEVIFTPGDYVLSSSQLIESFSPSLRTEKLISAMERHGATFPILHEILDTFSERTVHVVGDTIVDTITTANVIGSGVKTPTLSVQFDNERHFVGGAAVVARHLKAAGANVIFSTVIGDDDIGRFAIGELESSGIQCSITIDKKRPTTHKNTIVAGGYRLLKVDTVDNQPISEDIVNGLADDISSRRIPCVVFSDFRHGIFNRHTIPILTSSIPNASTKVADSQVASRWGNIIDFYGFDLITPNEREARFALGDQDSGVRPLATSLHEAAGCDTLILKLGARGVLTCRPGENAVSIDSFVDNLVDAVGAGDALLAYATLGMLATKSSVVASIIGVMAASCECEMDGNIPICSEYVHEKLNKVERE